jgi:hypothetical protein
LEKQVKDELAKSEQATKIDALERQAQDWRARAAEGCVAGLDPDTREHLVLKAGQAEEQAAQLRAGAKPKADPARAANWSLRLSCMTLRHWMLRTADSGVIVKIKPIG